jgi:hypothetical protein
MRRFPIVLSIRAGANLQSCAGCTASLYTCRAILRCQVQKPQLQRDYCAAGEFARAELGAPALDCFTVAISPIWAKAGRFPFASERNCAVDPSPGDFGIKPQAAATHATSRDMPKKRQFSAVPHAASRLPHAICRKNGSFPPFLTKLQNHAGFYACARACARTRTRVRENRDVIS